MNRKGVSFVAAALALALSSRASVTAAADTVETWERGAVDVEAYVGYEGLGPPGEQRTIFADALLGYGFLDRLSAYAGTTLEGADGFDRGASTHYLGVFGTPLDSGHVDVDVFLDFSQGGPDQTFQVRPALELNLDEDPDMQTWGAYLRAPLPIYGRKLSSPLHPDPVSFHLESSVGAYALVANGHQLLLEYDMGYHPDPSPDERRLDVGGLALGYNATLTDGLELISEISTDIPQDDEKWSFGVVVGFIATLPSAAR